MDSELSIIAFSDWRVQSFERLVRLLNTLPTPDIIIYAGDDTNRFKEYPTDHDIDFHIYRLSSGISDISQIIDKFADLSRISKRIARIKVVQTFEKKLLNLTDMSKEKRNYDLIYSYPVPKIQGVENISISIIDGGFDSFDGLWHSGYLELEYGVSNGKIVRLLSFQQDVPFDTRSFSKETKIKLYHAEIEIEMGGLLHELSLINTVNKSRHLKKLYQSEDDMDRIIYQSQIMTIRRSIKPIAISDLQDNLKKYAKIINAGNDSVTYLLLPDMKNPNSINKMKSFVKMKKKISFINWFQRLSAFSKCGIYAILGNDCWPSDMDIIQGDRVFYIGGPKNAELLDWELIGLNGTEEGENAIGPTKISSGEITDKFRKIQKDKVMVVTHTPPKGILDIGIRFGVKHIGSETLRQEIDNNKNVKLVICGHVHSHGGMHQKNKHYTVVNASSHDDPGSTGNVALIRVDDNIEVEWYDTTPELERIDGVGHSLVRKFESHGIITREQLNTLTFDEIMSIGDLSKTKANNLMEKVRISGLEGGEWSGNLKVPPINKTIFLDIETDTMSNKIWLIGILLNGDVEQMTANNWKEEKEILLKFQDYLERNPAIPVVFYSATHFDYRVIKNAAKRLKLKKLLRAMKNRAWVDLTLIIKKVYKTGYSMGLKKMCDYLGYKRSHVEYNGLRIAQQYEAMVMEGDVNHEFLKLAREYNLDDIKSLPFIINALSKSDPNRVITEEKYINKPEGLTRALNNLNRLTINEKDDIKKSYISVTCSYEAFNDVYYGIISSGTTLPAITFNKSSVRLTWKGSTGFTALNEILTDFGYEY